MPTSWSAKLIDALECGRIFSRFAGHDRHGLSTIRWVFLHGRTGQSHAEVGSAIGLDDRLPGPWVDWAFTGS